MSWRSKGLVTGSLLALAACANVEREFPNKSAQAYRLDQARFALDKYEFDAAIENMAPLLLKNPTDPDVAYVGSMSYAGRAGLRILDLFSLIADKVSDEGILQIVTEGFPDSTDDNMSDIEQAMSILEVYGARAADRTSDINFYALFMYYSRIGITLNRYAYDPNTDALDPAFTACSRTSLPNSAVDTVMTTLPRIIDTATSAAASGSGFDELRNIESMVPAGIDFDPIPCSSDPDNALCLAVRNLIAKGKSTGGIGLGTGESICIATQP